MRVKVGLNKHLVVLKSRLRKSYMKQDLNT